MLDSLKIAIVCDWLTVFAGAERVVYEMHQLFPKAPLFTTLYNKKACPGFSEAELKESSLRYFPGARRAYRLFLPFMPMIFEGLDLRDYDLVLSSSHSVAKGIITQPQCLHVSYCHSPMRYVWDHSHAYQEQFRAFSALRWLYKPLLHKIRLWDRLAAERVDCFLTNSHYVARRLKKYYGKESSVLPPPVDLDRFRVGKDHEDFYLVVGRLIPYKRCDLAIQACEKLKRPLKIVGEGVDFRHLKHFSSSRVEFLGRISDEALSKLYRSARALLFPQLEDFGIVPVEAMASGTPVLAYKGGGALETIEQGVSGLFFPKQTTGALVTCIKEFEQMNWNPEKVAESASRFSSPHFRSSLRHFLEKAWKEHQAMLG